MTATLEELTTPLTRAEAEDAIYAAIAALGIDTTAWKVGGATRTVIVGVAIILSAASTVQALLAKSGFLEKAEGDWLTLVAKYVYDVDRDLGTFATGTLKLDNTLGNLYVLAAGDLVALNPTSEKSYRTTAAVTINPLETNVLVAAQCTELGSGGTSSPGTITQLETVLLGVSVTNLVAFVGTDTESDAALRERCYAKTGTLSPNGPADAYRYLALSATKDDGTPANVTRVTTVPDGEGNVTVYVASASGAVSGTVGDTTTDLGAVDEAIQTLAVPLAVTATVASATPLEIDVTYEVWVKSTIGITDADLYTLINTALATYLSTARIGGFLKAGQPGRIYVDALEGVIGATVGSQYLIDVAVTVPAADVDVAATEAPVLGASISATINLETN